MKKILFLFFLVIGISSIYGQVNLQTGSATFSLPMFNWQDNKSRLNSLVALDYNSGNGLRVSSVASNVGQGWGLIAGGVITRIQAGEPDDQKPRNGFVEDVTKYPPGYLYNPTSPAAGSPVALNKYPIYRDKNHIYKQHNEIAADREFDYFSFQFNGRTGLFILDKTTGEGVPLGDTKLKIYFTRNESAAANWGFRTTINSFSIQDENGLIYRFGNISNTLAGNSYLGRTKVLKVNYCDSKLNPLTQPKFKNGEVYQEAAFEDPTIVNPFVVDGWYLAEIEDGLTHRKVYLNYEPRNINASSGTDIAHYFSDKDYVVLSRKTSITVTPVITSIVYPDGHNVTFNYPNGRFDLNGDYALGSVDITYNGRYLSRYKLNTSYFILNRYGKPVSEYQKNAARLCLLSVEKYGVDLKAAEPFYGFDYYMGSNDPDDFVPPPFFYAKDIWGYYNGDYSRNADNVSVPLNSSILDLTFQQLKGLCFLRNGLNPVLINPKAEYAKNGLLKQIVYPTGGTLSYEYIQNSGILDGQSSNVGGVHVSKTTVTDGGYTNGCNNPITTNYNYVLEGSSQSSLWGLEMPVNIAALTSHYEPESKYYYYKPFFGACAYRFQYPGILSKDQAVSITRGQRTMITISKILDIVSIITTVMDVATVVGASTGFFAWAAVIIDFIGNLAEVVLTCFSNQSTDNTTTICYNSDINAINPLPYQFKRVEVVQNTGTAGKTVHEFTSSDDYPVWNTTNPAFSMKQRYASWAYGLPKKLTNIDANGNIVSRTENIYDTAFAKRIISVITHPMGSVPKYPGCKSLVLKNYSQRSSQWIDPNIYNPPPYGNYITESNSDVNVDIYYACTGRMELRETHERVYKQGTSQYIQTSTEYTYNSLYLPSSIITTQSNGSKTGKYIRYSGEYNGQIWPTGPALLALNQNNVISIPIETTATTFRNGEFFYLNEQVTEFAFTANGDVKPYRTLEQRFKEPQSVLSGGHVNFKHYNGPGNSENPPYVETQSFIYDGTGNLIGLKDEGNHVVSNIYDYNDKYVVASVINADPLIDKPAYTGFETTGLGGWTLSAPANYVSASITGNRSLDLGSSDLSAQLNISKPYKLTFWATNNNVTVSGGATLIRSNPVINGFTYYEYDIPQGTSTVTLAGNATIDELRLYPKTTRMRTISYDPLIGKTSECDENNRCTYYDYDEFGRLRFIKDEYQHIVKMYEYNTVNVQRGCPTTYTNLLISEVFVKNNCFAGYAPSSVVYSIPAGKYSSTLSQADADQKAEDELNSNGQAYANSNGSCIMLYYNTAKSQDFTKENCADGYKGAVVSYSVPAHRYSSTISQAKADMLAQQEIDANGQAHANTTGGCTVDIDPIWEADETAQTKCEVNYAGANTGYMLMLMTDINPNSSTYHQTQWKNMGANTATCPAANITMGSAKSNTTFAIMYTNVYTNQTYTFSIGPNTSGLIHGPIPFGTYNVETYPLYNSQSYSCSVNNSYMSGTGHLYWTNVPMNCTTCATVQIW